MKILLIEDDRRIALPLKEDLEHQLYTVDLAGDGDCGWAMLSATHYDLVVLDLMLPGMSGLELCRRLRERGQSVPILVLTARAATEDKVRGLDAGADDYLVKPFELDELAARVRALLRRPSDTLTPVLRWGALALDPASRTVTYQERRIELPPVKFMLLELFLRYPEQVFSRETLLERLWSLEDPPNDEVVKAHIKGLRDKLREAGVTGEVIETVFGHGYRLKAHV